MWTGNYNDIGELETKPCTLGSGLIIFIRFKKE